MWKVVEIIGSGPRERMDPDPLRINWIFDQLIHAKTEKKAFSNFGYNQNVQIRIRISDGMLFLICVFSLNPDPIFWNIRIRIYVFFYILDPDTTYASGFRSFYIPVYTNTDPTSSSSATRMFTSILCSG